MKTHPWLTISNGALAISLSVASVTPTRAFTDFARGEFLLATTGSATYDSRIQGSRGGDDFIFSLRPDLLYRREAALIKVEGSAGIVFNRYAEYTQYDSEDIDSHIIFKLPKDVAGTHASGEFRSSYFERTNLDYDANQRIRSKKFDAHLDSLFPVGLKTSVSLLGNISHDAREIFGTLETREGGAGFNYHDFLGGSELSLRYRRFEANSSGQGTTQPLDQGSDTYSVSLARPIYGEIRGTVSYGYRILQRSAAETNMGITRSAGAVVSASLVGPFLPVSMFPKLESSLSLAYEEAETPGINDVGGKRLTGNANITWSARETTKITFTAHRGMELSTDNRTAVTTGGMVQVDQAIGHFIQARAGGGFERRSYRGVQRDDDIITGLVGMNYRATAAWTLAFDGRLRSTDSTDINAAYDRHVLRLSATYTF